jgi:signal transduction histidine kinase
VLGRTVRDVLAGYEPAWIEAYARVATTGRPERFEIPASPEGRAYAASAWSPAPGQFACVLEDVTERRQAEEATRAAAAEQARVAEALREADRRKDEFLGMLSHELRNPLAPIRNSTYILRRAPPGSEAALRAQAVIERQSEQLTRLVDDLLDVTRIARGKIELRREPLDLRDVVLRAADDHRGLFEPRALALQVDVPPHPVTVHADGTRLAQVVGNLLHNASKFTRAGDHVRVTVRTLDARAVLSVRDTGAGIDPALLGQVFEPFVQGERTLARSQGGLGLGLALVRAIAELHGGSARAESAGVGRGAELVVELPLAAEGG